MSSQYGASRVINRRQEKLFRQWWLPPDKPKANVVICHGYGEHSSRYTKAAEFLTKHGYAVYTMDHHGHGQSEGQQTLLRDHMDLVHDFQEFTQDVRNIYQPGLPLFLLGHSMGGAITLQVASLEPEAWAGVLFSAPLFSILPMSSLTWTVSIAQAARSLLPSCILTTLRSRPWRYLMQFVESLLLALILQGTLLFIKMALWVAPETMPTARLDSAALCTRKDVVETYLKDPLVDTKPLKLRTFYEMLRLMDLCHAPQVLDRCNFPAALFHGSGDIITPIDGTLEVLGQFPSTKKALFVYPGMYHEILNEDLETVLGDMIGWMDSRLSTL